MTHPQVRPDPALGLLELYDDALPHACGYLLARCCDTGLAEELAAESFLAAVHAAGKPGAPDPSIPTPASPGGCGCGQAAGFSVRCARGARGGASSGAR